MTTCRVRPRPVVGHRPQGRADLRLPGAAHAVQHLVRAPRRRPDAAPHRPQRARPVRPAAVPRRRREAGAQGRHHPEGRRQGRLHPGADPRGDPGVPGLGGHPVRPRGHDPSPTRHAAAADRLPGRRALHPGHRLDRHLRHRARRLVLRLDVPAARRPALQRPDDLATRSRWACRSSRCSSTPARCRRRRSSPRRTDLWYVILAVPVVRHLRASRWSARPTARRSTCPRPRASWSAASTPSTPR